MSLRMFLFCLASWLFWFKVLRKSEMKDYKADSFQEKKSSSNIIKKTCISFSSRRKKNLFAVPNMCEVINLKQANAMLAEM